VLVQYLFHEIIEGIFYLGIEYHCHIANVTSSLHYNKKTLMQSIKFAGPRSMVN